MDIIEELSWRGLIHQCTDIGALQQRISAGSLTLYCGFDPTAKSLHVGSLVPLVTLARFSRAGHRSIGLIGGATGLIGDPSGKSKERVLQTEDIVQAQSLGVGNQVARFTDGVTRNNIEWTAQVSFLEFLRDVGKHFSVNAMMARDSVASRLGREGEGISFTEFSYMLLQANDFLVLNEREGCELQIGGSDQWGNMVSGVDLIRRKTSKQAFALTMPLLTMSDGQKFGKTAQGAVWLDKELTSVWEFFQFWLNTPDADVIKMLKLLTFLSKDEIEALESEVQSNAQARAAQRALAHAMTSLIHGEAAAKDMGDIAAVLFGKHSSVSALSLGAFDELSRALPVVRVAPQQAMSVVDLLVLAGLEGSKTRATQAIGQGAVSLNDRRIGDAKEMVQEADWVHRKFALIKKGKKSFALAVRG